MFPVLFGGVAAFHKFGACTVWWCDSVSYEWWVKCVVVWQRDIGIVRDLCGGVAVCHI